MKTKTKTLANQINLEKYNYSSTTTVGLWVLIILGTLVLFTSLTSCKKQQAAQPQQQSINTIVGNYRDSSGLACSHNVNIQFLNNQYYMTSPDYWSCDKKMYLTIATQGSIYNATIDDHFEYNSQLKHLQATGSIINDTLILFITDEVIQPGNLLYNQQPIKHIYIKI